MSDINAVLDEHAAGQVFAMAQTTLGTVAGAGSTSFGPFTASYGASASFTGGTLQLVPPNIVKINQCSLNYTVNFTLSFDLSNIIPNLYIPGFTIKITKWLKIKIPPITVNWPNVSIPVKYSDSAHFSASFALHPHLASPNWRVDIVVLGVPGLQFSLAAAAILSLIGAAAAAVLAPIPLLGPFMAVAVLGITNTVGIAGVTNLLGLMLTPLVSGATFTLYNQPRHFPLLPAAGPYEPAVFIDIDRLTATIINAGEPELVLGMAVTAP